MKYKYYIIFLILLFLSSISFSLELEPSHTYEIDSVTPCYGQVEIFVAAKEEFSSNEISFNKCLNVNNTRWVCDCELKRYKNITLTTSSFIRSNVYDIIISYNIASIPSFKESGVDEVTYKSIKHNVNRLSRHNDIIVNGEEKVIQNSFIKKLNDMKGPGNNVLMFVIIIFVIIILIVILVIYILYRMFIVENKNNEDNKKEILNDILK